MFCFPYFLTLQQPSCVLAVDGKKLQFTHGWAVHLTQVFTNTHKQLVHTPRYTCLAISSSQTASIFAIVNCKHKIQLRLLEMSVALLAFHLTFRTNSKTILKTNAQLRVMQVSAAIVVQASAWCRLFFCGKSYTFMQERRPSVQLSQTLSYKVSFGCWTWPWPQ